LELLNLLKPANLPIGERRESLRLRCELSVLLRADDLLYFATVVDVSLTGLRLLIDSRLKPGQTVSLARDDFGHPWHGDVLWCKAAPKRTAKGYYVGVGYPPDPEMLRATWLQPALKQMGFQAELPGQKRRLLRIPGRVACQIKGLTGETYTEGEMLDLSMGGAKVECPMEFPVGLSVEFETAPLGGLPALKGIAKIASCSAEGDRWRCGLRFTEVKEEDVKKSMGSMLSSR
jgi:hypothetical protein